MGSEEPWLWKEQRKRKWRLHVSLQDGPELELSHVRVNLQDERISTSIEAAI